MKSSAYLVGPLILCHLVNAIAGDGDEWVQSYQAGYRDDNGAWAGGSEIMHLVAHRGKLFAANGYWLDSRWEIPPDHQRQSAQVLRLDSAGGRWQVDLEMGKSNDHGLGFMKGNILKSVTFTRDASGQPLPEPVNLLVMAAGANFERGGAVYAWVRNDADGSWKQQLVRHGSSIGGIRWVPRDMQVYRDKITGTERLFLSLGNPGIITGVYDPSSPHKIRWSRDIEFPFPEKGTFRTRPLGIAEANGSLFFSVDGSIYRRRDGKRPTYERIMNLSEETDTDIGGVRGLTAIDNPSGNQSLLFLWAPGNGARSEIKRIDFDENGKHSIHDEVSILDLMSKHLGVRVTNTLGAHNMMYPFLHPKTKEKVHIIGFQGGIAGKHNLRWQGSSLYAGALYAIRTPDRKYTIHEVNNAYQPGKHLLVSARAFCNSPFGDGQLFVGGHDSSNHPSDNMAWIFRTSLDVGLGIAKGKTAPSPKAPPAPDRRVIAGPVYELRMYIAGEGRLNNLLKRFREHTDRIFKKHHMEPVGYWLPTEGTPRERRTFVYILKHPSRYEAWKNWVRFNNDRQWKSVVERPEFRGLLVAKPTSIFMTENDYSSAVKESIEKVGGIFELRIYRANAGKLAALNARFRDHTTGLFAKHGIHNFGYWTPFDDPESATDLIYLVHHASRDQADLNWKSFSSDPAWKKVAEESQRDGKFLAERPQRIYLKPTDFSPLK